VRRKELSPATPSTLRMGIRPKLHERKLMATAVAFKTNGAVSVRFASLECPARNFSIQIGRKDLTSIMEEKLIIFSPGSVSRSCCDLHSAVGYSVTLKWTRRLDPISATNT
jgi:hypothetical protein